MVGIVFLFFIISLLLFIGAFHHVKLIHSMNSYPPKHMLKKRAAALTFGGFTAFLIALVLYYTQK